MAAAILDWMAARRSELPNRRLFVRLIVVVGLTVWLIRAWVALTLLLREQPSATQTPRCCARAPGGPCRERNPHPRRPTLVCHLPKNRIALPRLPFPPGQA